MKPRINGMVKIMRMIRLIDPFEVMCQHVSTFVAHSRNQAVM